MEMVISLRILPCATLIIHDRQPDIGCNAKKAPCHLVWTALSFSLPLAAELVGCCVFADAQLLLGNDCTVAVDVGLDEVIKQTTTLTYKHLKSALSSMIFVI